MGLRVGQPDAEVSDVRLLPPGLPALFLNSSRSSSYTVVKPRISHVPSAADSRSSAYGSASEHSNSGAFTSGSRNDNRTHDLSDKAPNNGSRNSHQGIRVSMPRRFHSMGAAFGIGGGGGLGGFFGGGPTKAVSLWPFNYRKPADSPAEQKDTKRVLILMSNTGGGHKASAEAIKAAFIERYGDKYQVDVVDLWKEHTPWPFNRMPNSYSFLVRHSILWKLSYELTQPNFVHAPYLSFCGVFMRNGLEHAFEKYKPHLVVSVHPLMQHIPVGVLRRRIKAGRMAPTNFATVITDFTTCHNTWFHRGVTRCFVPTQYCRMLALRNGLQEEQIIQHGLPIRPIFSKPLPPRPELKRQLGLDPELPAVLLVGGGEGMGKLEATVHELALKLGRSAQVVVICGRNHRLLSRLRHKRHPNSMPVIACGFVDNIHQWMAASDAIITKAGPGTIAEALISGLPILLNGNIPCQEEGNIPYVIDNGVGTFETAPGRIAHTLQRWLGPEREEFEEMGRRSKQLGRPEAVYHIVEDLAKLADAPDKAFGPATVVVGLKRRAAAAGKVQAP